MEIALAVGLWLVVSVLAALLFGAICRGGRVEEEDRAAWLEAAEWDTEARQHPVA